MINTISNTIDAIKLIIYRMVPDSILIPRIEAQMNKREVAANQAQEQLAMFVARAKREMKELQKPKEKLEAEIATLLERGLTEAAGERMEAFEQLEDEFNAKEEEYTTGLADFEAAYEESQIAIKEMANKLKAIKSQSARAQTATKLNDLRKAVGNTKFEVGGLNDDIQLSENRSREALDQATGTKMMLDKKTEQTREKTKETKDVKAATNAASLARFAAKRGLSVAGANSTTSSSPAPIMQDEVKTKA